MIVQCPSCEARYRIGAENVPQQGGKISCPSCSQSFIVYPEMPDINDDETRAGGVPFVLQEAMAEPHVEDGTVEIQNPMKTWLESQKNQPVQEMDDAPTSVVRVSDLPFDNFADEADELDDKTEMINLGDFLELENSEVEYDATEIFTIADQEAEALKNKLASELPTPGAPKKTLLFHGQNALPPLQKPGGLPPLQAPSGLPPLQAPAALPPLQAPSGLPPLQKPGGLAPLQPSALPPIQPVQAQPVAPSINAGPSVLPPISQGSLPQPALGSQVAVAPVPSSIPDLGVGQQNIQSDPNFAGPWKLRTNFGLTYEFPDTPSLNSWMSSREDVSGYTLAGNGDFYPLSYFPQIRPKHAGTSGSFSMHQPSGLPPADFLNTQQTVEQSAPFVPMANQGQANIPMLQQPTDYKAFSKSDTNVPTKESGGILPLFAWLFCGLSGIMMVVTALYVFGIIGASLPGLMMLARF